MNAQIVAYLGTAYYLNPSGIPPLSSGHASTLPCRPSSLVPPGLTALHGRPAPFSHVTSSLHYGPTAVALSYSASPRGSPLLVFPWDTHRSLDDRAVTGQSSRIEWLFFEFYPVSVCVSTQ